MKKQLIYSHCGGREKKFIWSLPERQKAKAADLIAALKSTFNDASEEESREARAHGTMTGLKRRKGEIAAKYARRARRIADHIDPKHDNLLEIIFRDSFKSKWIRRHLLVRDAVGKTSFEVIYQRFIPGRRGEREPYC